MQRTVATPLVDKVDICAESNQVDRDFIAGCIASQEKRSSRKDVIGSDNLRSFTVDMCPFGKKVGDCRDKIAG
jgi:hypothetical protein